MLLDHGRDARKRRMSRLLDEGRSEEEDEVDDGWMDGGWMHIRKSSSSPDRREIPHYLSMSWLRRHLHVTLLFQPPLVVHTTHSILQHHPLYIVCDKQCTYNSRERYPYPPDRRGRRTAIVRNRQHLFFTPGAPFIPCRVIIFHAASKQRPSDTHAGTRALRRPPARPRGLNCWGPSYAYWVTMAGLNVVLMLPCAPA